MSRLRCRFGWGLRRSIITPGHRKSRFRNIGISGVGLGMAGGASLLIPGLNLIVVPAVAIRTMVDKAGGRYAGHATNRKMFPEHARKLLDLLHDVQS